MNLNLKVFIIRALMGVAAGYFLTRFFLSKGPGFGGGDYVTAAVLAVIVVVAAYVSEAWRNRNQ
jgi:uncharacterized membrane protein